MQLHVSVMFNMHKKWSGSVVYAATETRVSRLNMFLPRFRLRILAISSCDTLFFLAFFDSRRLLVVQIDCFYSYFRTLRVNLLPFKFNCFFDLAGLVW